MNLGPLEILVILIIALVVFGPKRLPEVGRQVGGALRELRRMQDTVRSEISAALEDVPEEPDAPTEPVERDVPEAPEEPDHEDGAPEEPDHEGGAPEERSEAAGPSGPPSQSETGSPPA